MGQMIDKKINKKWFVIKSNISGFIHNFNLDKNKATLADNSLTPELNCINIKLRVIFDRNCLKQDKATFTNKKLVNIFIV